MFKEALSPATKRNLEILGQDKLFKIFYLAGGTACALHFGHRFSYDLDFFTRRSFNQKIIIKRLRNLGSFELDRQAEDTILGYLNKVKISFFKYDYPILFSGKSFAGIRVLDLKDITCMKLDAVSTRGTKKDFIDLYFIVKSGINLEKILGLFPRKFPGIRYNFSHLIKSLAYFEDAEKEKMPEMIKSVFWTKVKDFFREEQKRLAKKYLKI